MDKATLIYDGECPLCSGAAVWVERKARPGAVETVPCQSPERARRFPEVNEAECMDAMQLITPEGNRYSGDQAIPHVLRLMKGWRWLACVFRVPGVSLAAPHAYRWVADHRQALSVIAGRGMHRSGCDSDDRCGN
jgi:predicted DCC family thiol-disulfide oxidoreductase YuxK